MEQIIDKPKLTPKFFFLSLGVLVSLITSVTAFLNLVFEALNKKFPDVLNATYEYGYNTYQFDSMRVALATLIIVFPIFIALAIYWQKAIKSGLGRTDETIRKWVIYLIVFLALTVAVVDLVTLVRYFVSGEITLRFILKVLITLAVAKWVGLYYLYQVRESRWKNIVMKVVPWSANIFVAGAVVFAFVVMGSPLQQRQLRLDDRRIGDLQNIQWQVINYYQQKEKLPEALNDLKNPISGQSIPVDPEFQKGLSYEYKKLADLKFELCATFSLPIPKGWQEYNYGGGKVFPLGVPTYEGRDVSVSYPYPGGGMNESWDHEAGRTCFERTIDPELYPPFKSL